MASFHSVLNETRAGKPCCYLNVTGARNDPVSARADYHTVVIATAGELWCSLTRRFNSAGGGSAFFAEGRVRELQPV